MVASIPPTPELRKLMEIAFSRRYGIATEFVPARGGAVVQRLVSEAKAGVQYFDLHIGGTESVITAMLPENILDAIDPYLILPEVRDPKHWWGGHIYIDNAKRYIYNFVAYQTVSLWSDPNQYKPSEFKSFDDLLSPKLQAKIGISDPRTPGSGSSMWSYMHYIKGEEYLRKLVGAKTVYHPRPASVGGESREGQDRRHFRHRLFGVPAVYQSQSSGGAVASAERRALHQRRLRPSDRVKKQPSSQCHQSFRQLAAQPRRPRSLRPRHGRGQSPAWRSIPSGSKTMASSRPRIF